MDKAMIVSLVVAALAVAAAGVTTWMSIRFNGQVRALESAFENFRVAADSRSAELERQTSRANERAASLERDVEAARERALQLEKGVADADARATEAKLALAQLKAPRSITDDQKKALVERLKKFPGTSASVWLIHAPSQDAAALAARLTAVLSEAGWQAVGVNNLMGGPVFRGVAVVTRGDPSAADQAAAITLAGELNTIGITAARQTGVTDDPVSTLGAFTGPNDGTSNANLWIVVGSKP